MSPSAPDDDAERFFSRETGVDLTAMEPNDIAVHRTPLREGATPFPGQPEAERPVWILVTRGRAVVSCSRVLYRVACAWAEDFAAADHLLRPEFSEDLRRAVARSLDAEVRVETWRVFLRPGAPGELRWVVAEGDRAGTVFAATEARGESAAALCPVQDRDAARALFAAGGRERARLSTLQAIRNDSPP